MSTDGAELPASSRGLHNSGEELNDEGLRAIRLVFSQRGLAKSIPPDEVSDDLKMCINRVCFTSRSLLPMCQN